jgi:hypothetical protein
MRDRLKGFAADAATWFGANLVCSAAALIVTYLTVTTSGGGRLVLAPLLGAAGLLSLTWGSWISLTWTRNRPLRVAMKAITLIPGSLLLALAGIGIYSGFGSLFTWLLLMGSAIGTCAVAVMLWRRFPYATASRTNERLAFGFFVYPAVTALGAAAIFGIWFAFAQDPFSTAIHQRFDLGFGFISYITSVVTALAVELTTTVIPAATSMVCSDTDQYAHEG